MSSETPEVVVVDYGMGNLFSVERAISRAGGHARVTRNPADLSAAERIIVPGVGAFGDGMANLVSRGFDVALRQSAAAGQRILGICLGMQLMLGIGEEFGVRPGLGLVPGRVIRFDDPVPDGPQFKIPHVGWSAIVPRGAAVPASQEQLEVTGPSEWDGTPLGGLPRGSFVYFVHSYIVVPESPDDILAETEYGTQRFCSAIGRGSVYGCQFHPELSGEVGLTIMRNFLSDSGA
jgi:imidazole glycerol-phosphate synthase subunit HisH